MQPSEYQRMHDLETSHWWFQGRRTLVLSLLEPLLARREGPTLLDVGCGTGMILEDLSERGRAVGADFSELALRFSHERGLTRLVRADAETLPFVSGSADLVTLLDITEHVADDGALLREVARVLRPGGEVLFTVPAHPFLWSEHDRALWHKRRYRRREFLHLVRGAGLEVERCSYAFMFTFLPAALVRGVKKILPQRREPRSDTFPLPGWLNRALAWTLRVEAWLMRRVNLPMGITLVVVARRGA